MTKPMWMEYADLFSRLTIPVVVPVSLAIFAAITSAEKAKTEAAGNCIDLQLKLFNAVCADNDCNVSKSKGRMLVALDDMIRKRCEEADVSPSKGAISSALSGAAMATTDVGTAASLRQAAGELTPKVTVKDGAPPAVATTENQLETKGKPLGPRVYVHISNSNQRDAALNLVKRLDNSTIRGQSLNGLGPELVAPPYVESTELRCFTDLDCENAQELASYISGITQSDVNVANFAKAYKNRKLTIRPGHFELWVAEGPIRVIQPTPN